MKKLVLGLLALIAVLGIAIFGVMKLGEKQPEHETVCETLPENVKFEQDIVYKESRQENCKLDIAYPNDGQKHPLVVFVHGGTWVEGSKKSMYDYVYSLSNLGYVAATVDYDLYSLLDMETDRLISIRDEEQCVDDAMEWLAKHANEYGIDTEQIFLAGHSAGGQLVGRLAERLAEEPEKHAYQLKGVILMAAASDFRMLLYGDYDDGKTIAPLVLTPFAFAGDYDGELFHEVDKVDVLANVRGDMAPMLLIHGDYDAAAPYQMSEHLYQAITEAGGVAELSIIHEHGHNLSPHVVVDEVSRFMASLIQEAK